MTNFCDSAEIVSIDPSDIENISPALTICPSIDRNNHHRVSDILETKDLSVSCHNINRLYSKMDEIRYYLKVYFPVDIYGVVETFLDENVNDSEILINNYNVVRKDRICSGGGGILIYVKQYLNYRRIPELELPIIEAIFIELQFSNGNILVGFIYRPPNNNLVNYSEWLIIMDNLLDKINNTYNKVILLGDFNIDLLPTAVQKTSWINTFQSYYLNQLIDEPTRITSHSKTLLDHIYVFEDVNVSKSGLLSWAISDHNPIYITINKSNYVTNHDKIKNKHKTISYRKLADVDINTLGPCILDKLNFIDNSKDTNVNDLTSSWTSRVLSIIDTHWPVRTKRIKEHLPGWLTADIRKLMKERDTFKSSKSFVKYKKLRNKCKKEIKKAKSKYYINLIEANKNNQNIISKIFQDLGSKIKHRKTINKLTVD